MTKVEQLKARAYAIELLELQIKNQEETKKCYEGQKLEEMAEWEIRALTEADDKIRKLEYVIEELAR